MQRNTATYLHVPLCWMLGFKGFDSCSPRFAAHCSMRAVRARYALLWRRSQTFGRRSSVVWFVGVIFRSQLASSETTFDTVSVAYVDGVLSAGSLRLRAQHLRRNRSNTRKTHVRCSGARCIILPSALPFVILDDETQGFHSMHLLL